MKCDFPIQVIILVSSDDRQFTVYSYFRGGVKYAEVSPVQARDFNRNILKTIIQLETTFFEMAFEDKNKRNVIIVCDRGTFDPSACE